jgi:hypothetical protein
MESQHMVEIKRCIEINQEDNMPMLPSLVAAVNLFSSLEPLPFQVSRRDLHSVIVVIFLLQLMSILFCVTP